MECSSICSECKSVFGDLSELQEHLPECLLESYESINWENFSPNVSIYDDGECPVSYIEVETSNLQTEDNRLSAVVSVQIPCEWNGSVCTEIPKRVALPAVDDVPPVIVGSEAVIDGPGLRSDTKMKCPENVRINAFFVTANSGQLHPGKCTIDLTQAKDLTDAHIVTMGP
ncbi:unnamed protein product [Bursaphelenchus xylophilus]|uniref:(pine wood nematode) hypothetical protein n=1 Tax=Bursaphelenchus xylophilus TaxID=6326 RepID=A0A7I8XIN9_BURXY|nr:unnamed protein product [Bursaphelenchus xylophilus]CAG9084955.1 unnamed protein product [Bursaphelenchus xylophilus]